MAETTGIIFADLFINDKKFFVDFFSSYYEANQTIIDKAITNLDQVLKQYTTKAVTKEMADSFKTAWNNFENIVLMNKKDLQLIVSYRGTQEYDATFSQIVEQSKVEGEAYSNGALTYGINSGHQLIQESMEALKASEIEKFLQKHLNDFLNQLRESITGEEAHRIHMYHEYCLLSALQNSEEHITGKSWINAFYSQSYGHYYGGQGLGQAYDAFMNHLANKETAIYSYLRTNGQQFVNTEVNTNKRTVYVEEKGVLKVGNFAELLKESRNHIGWYTGGDIVIVSPETMEIVYNIQLKTTGRKTLSVFTEKVEAIRRFIDGLIALSPKEKGERIFDFLLTSISNYDAFNKLPQKTVNNIIRQELTSKLGIDFSDF